MPRRCCFWPATQLDAGSAPTVDPRPQRRYSGSLSWREAGITALLSVSNQQIRSGRRAAVGLPVSYSRRSCRMKSVSSASAAWIKRCSSLRTEDHSAVINMFVVDVGTGWSPGVMRLSLDNVGHLLVPDSRFHRTDDASCSSANIVDAIILLQKKS